MVLPGTSGPRLAAELISARPDLRVLYMSGFTENAIVHHGVLDPDTEFIAKPFTPEILATRARQLLAADSAVQGAR